MQFFYHDRKDMQAEVFSPNGVYRVEGLEEGMFLENGNPTTEHAMANVERDVHVAEFC
jgi:hypothetical protein